MEKSKTFNVGGSRFTLSHAELEVVTGSRVCNEEFLKGFNREKPEEVYFDRNPQAFEAVVNFCKTGYLHLPNVSQNIFWLFFIKANRNQVKTSNTPIEKYLWTP